MRNSALLDSLSSQRKWIDEHGGCEAGYVDRYGNPDMNRCYGDGGSAIWQADKAELTRLEEMARHRKLI